MGQSGRGFGPPRPARPGGWLGGNGVGKGWTARRVRNRHGENPPSRPAVPRSSNRLKRISGCGRRSRNWGAGAGICSKPCTLDPTEGHTSGSRPPWACRTAASDPPGDAAWRNWRRCSGATARIGTGQVRHDGARDVSGRAPEGLWVGRRFGVADRDDILKLVLGDLSPVEAERVRSEMAGSSDLRAWARGTEPTDRGVGSGCRPGEPLRRAGPPASDAVRAGPDAGCGLVGAAWPDRRRGRCAAGGLVARDRRRRRDPWCGRVAPTGGGPGRGECGSQARAEP
jgi:hypothetical protein